MKKVLGKQKNKIFILGAGASVDYGLPTWNKLAGLISEYLSNQKDENYQYKKEILGWLDLIGEEKRYKTLDECIYHQTSSNEYKEDGQDIEFEIFRILKEIFKHLYRKESSWIKNLNEKIRKKEGVDWNNLFFINYNYDSVLADNILDFSYLTKTERERIHRERIGELEHVKYATDYQKIQCLYPHGLFDYSDRGFLNEESDTINSHNNSLLQSVSCYHSKKHEVLFTSDAQAIDLYILGLGGGLKINLDNIVFNDFGKIKNIHITLKKHSNISDLEYQKNKKKIMEFLTEKYGLLQENIFVYDNCVDLIERCFSTF